MIPNGLKKTGQGTVSKQRISGRKPNVAGPYAIEARETPAVTDQSKIMEGGLGESLVFVFITLGLH